MCFMSRRLAVIRLIGWPFPNGLMSPSLKTIIRMHQKECPTVRILDGVSGFINSQLFALGFAVAGLIVVYDIVSGQYSVGHFVENGVHLFLIGGILVGFADKDFHAAVFAIFIHAVAVG